MNQILRYKCSRCGSNEYTAGEIWASRTSFIGMLGFHDRRFTFLSCQRCSFTEFYKVPLKKIGEVINFMPRQP